jgi:hypothetical protein
VSPVRGAVRIVLAAGVCFGAAAAAALPGPQLSSYVVEPIGQALLPDVVPLDGGERIVEHGEVVLRGRIAYRAVAAVAEPFEVILADQHIRVRPDQMLVEVRIRGGAMADVSGARTFCLPPRPPSEPQNAPGLIGAGGGDRFAARVQPCFVDRDSDGRLDFALLAGTRRAEDRAPVPLAALPYRTQADLPIEGAEVRISFNAHLSLTAPSLQLGVLLPGFDYRYVESIRARGPDGRMRGLPYDDDVPSRTYPHIITFGPARFEILGYDRETERVRLRVLEGFTRTDLEIVLAVDGRR